MKNPHVLGIFNENHVQRKKMTHFGRFWVKEPRHSEIIFAKKRYISYRSTRLSLTLTLGSQRKSDYDFCIVSPRCSA